MRRILALCLAVLPLPVATGCVAAAFGAGLGFLLSQEVLPNDVHTAQVMIDVERVWDVSRETMEVMSLEPIEVQEYPRKIMGKVEDADVTVEIFAYDLDRTTITVQAEKYMVSQGETARRVIDAIIERLAE